MAIPLQPGQVPKPAPQPPTEGMLRALVLQGAADVAQQMIDTWKLKLRIEGTEIKDALEGTELWLKRFVTVDPDTVMMKETIRKLAKCPDEVLITGETGTGKELVARAMIANRGDDKGKFVAVNCAGLPENLIESELFGHVKGAFTGAESQKQGLFAVAKDGVLFLDEIGELPLAVQAKLLRALQDKVIRKVGGNVEEEINCKFVCATHRSIKTMVKNEKFRQDLYARISTFELHIKPLRERECDVIPIIKSLPQGEAFIRACSDQNIPLHKLDLSLNVRSLQQVVKRWSVLGNIVI